MIRPFSAPYAVTVSHVSANRVSFALSAGFLVSLAALPIAGRWIDARVHRTVIVTALALPATGRLTVFVSRRDPETVAMVVAQYYSHAAQYIVSESPVGRSGSPRCR